MRVYSPYLEILNMDISIEDGDLLNFLNIYDLDFRSIRKNMDNDSLFEKLMRYALELDIYHSKGLSDLCSLLPSAFTIYNKISAYKYYIKGLLNACNIYKRFNYFYLDQFATSRVEDSQSLDSV